MRASEEILEEAEFDERVCLYWLFGGALPLAVTIVGIPLAILWLAVGMFWTRRYLKRLSATLTDRRLVVRKGWLVRVEKAIPLDKITDVGTVQGPLMRLMNLHKVTIETAGQSSAGQSLVALLGVKDSEGFRERVLEQRDRIADGHREDQAAPAPSAPPAAATDAEMLEILRDIRGSLQRLEGLGAAVAERT